MIYVFGQYVLDTQLHNLSCAGKPISLRPKAFEVLSYLLAHRDYVVSKQELCEQVWSGQSISDATLVSTVRAVRQAIGDNGEVQKLIVTVHGYGYRCVAAVIVRAEGESAPATEAQSVDLLPAFLPRLVADEKKTTAPEPFSSVVVQRLATVSSSSYEERKFVTVLCCGLGNTSDFLVQHSLDTLYNLMHALYEQVRSTVQQYGGILQPAMGHCVLAAFGVPMAQEDHAVRAALAALALRQQPAEWLHTTGTRPDITLAIRLGLHTGFIVVGDLGEESELTTALVGDVAAKAVALQEQAEPGAVLCSEATARLVRAEVSLEALTPAAETELWGQLYTILGRRSRRIPGTQHTVRPLSPFVGREREIATLHALLTQVEAGRGQVVGVVGEAGIGKSRLVAEFCHSLQGRRLTYLIGRCLSYGSATPYLPLLDLLRHYCGIMEDDGPEGITAKVYHSLQEAGLPPATWAQVFLSLLSLQERMQQLTALSPEARKARILTAYVQLCLYGSRQRCLVLEIDDMHWSDASSEDCLAELVERMAGAPILLLLTYRPGYRPAWLNKSYTTQMVLPPLDSQDSHRVIQAISSTVSLSEPTCEAILARADGNPLFLEELAHTVVEEGNASQHAVLPATLQAVLSARIDRLEPEAKRLLQVAAVIGKNIPLPLLWAAIQMPEALFQQHIRYLQNAELLYEMMWTAIPTLTFKHVLIQEAVYQSLLEGPRQQVHRQLARILVEQYPKIEETQPELLAHHYTEAGLSAQAITYWKRAGQYALDCSAYPEAIARLHRGLVVLQRLPKSAENLQHEIDLLILRGPALMATYGYAAPAVEATYTRARELCTQIGETPDLFPVLRGLWGFYFVRAELHTAHALGQQLLRLAPAFQDHSRLVVASYTVGATLLHRGEFLAARTHLERGNHLSTSGKGRQDNTISIDHGITCLLGTSWVLHILGYPDQALQKSRAALQLAREMVHPLGSAVTLSWAARLHQFRREPQAVYELAEALIALSTEQGFALWLALGQEQRAWALLVQGYQEEGVAWLRETLVANQATGRHLTQTYRAALLAEVYGHMEQAEEGLHIVTETLALVEKTAERFAEAELHRISGELLLQRHIDPNASHAERHFSHALEIAGRQQARWWELRAAVSLSRLWQRQGKPQAARTLLLPLYEWFTEGFDTVDLQEARALLAELS